MAMSNEENMMFKMEKLTSDNYHNWKYTMKLFLKGKGLWAIVTGDEVLQDGADDAAKKAYTKRADLALASIGLNVTKGLQVYVRNEETAKGAWDKLATRFEKKSLSKIISYRRKLYEVRAGKNTDMHTHTNYIKTVAEHLEAIGDVVAEKDLAIVLLSSLPEEYAQLVTALETATDPDDLTWDTVRDRVLNEFEKKRAHSEKSRGDDGALYTGLNGDGHSRSGGGSNRGRGNNRGGGRTRGGRGRGRGNGRGGHDRSEIQDYSNRKCYNCNEIGHFSRNCPQKNTGEDANVSNASDYVPEQCLQVGDDSEDDDWWIDSGASAHMTYEKSELYDFEEFDEGRPVVLADKSVVYAYGSGHSHGDLR